MCRDDATAALVSAARVGPDGSASLLLGNRRSDRTGWGAPRACAKCRYTTRPPPAARGGHGARADDTSQCRTHAPFHSRVAAVRCIHGCERHGVHLRRVLARARHGTALTPLQSSGRISRGPAHCISRRHANQAAAIRARAMLRERRRRAFEVATCETPRERAPPHGLCRAVAPASVSCLGQRERRLVVCLSCQAAHTGWGGFGVAVAALSRYASRYS